MSTPANTASGEKKEKGVDRLLSRMKSVLRRGDGSKRLSLSGRSPAAATNAPSAAEPKYYSFPLLPSAILISPSTTKVDEASPKPAPVTEPTGPKTAPDGPQPLKVMRSHIDAERANRLGQRFKLPKMEAHEFSSKPDMEAFRIEKPIRVRIHRTCHKCQTTFGGNKICASCEHPRCSNCPRYPVKKLRTGQGKGKENEAPNVEGYIQPDTYWGLRETYVLTLPSRTGGQPLVRKKPMQRVRRTCHQCSTLFLGGAKKCSNCDHYRCTDCPRDPYVSSLCSHFITPPVSST